MFIRPEFLRPFNLLHSRSCSPSRVKATDYGIPDEPNPSRGPNFTTTRSPKPTPASSPIKLEIHPFDDASPTRSIPKHPHPSFTKIGHRSSLLFHPYAPPKLERATRKKLQECRYSRAWLRSDRKDQDIPGAYPDETRTIFLDKPEKLSVDQDMEHETYPHKIDEIVVDQLEELEQEWEHEFEQCRQSITRVKDATMDEPAKKMWEESHEKEEAQKQHQQFVRDVQEEAKQPPQPEEQVRILHEQDMFYQEWVEKERKKLEEVECLLQEEKIGRARARLDREETMRQIHEQLNFLTQKDHEQCEEIERLRREELIHSVWREEQECLAREQQKRFVREQQECLAGQSKERFIRWMQEHSAREQQEHFAREQQEQICQQFTIYEAKWQKLQTSDTILPIHVHEIPWPVLSMISSAEQITYQDVRDFLFHPLRPDMQDKSAQDKVKSELFRFHPDKFDGWVVPKIRRAQQDVAKEIARMVVTILTRLMTEEQEDGK